MENGKWKMGNNNGNNRTFEQLNIECEGSNIEREAIEREAIEREALNLEPLNIKLSNTKPFP
jgi:hypothetical protein